MYISPIPLTLSLFTLLLQHPHTTTAQGSEGQFLEPPAAISTTPWDFSLNEVWSLGTAHTISWEAYYDNYTISVWHLTDDDIAQGTRGSRSPDIFELHGPAQATSFSWPVTSFGFNISDSPVFYLSLANNTSQDLDTTTDGASFISHWFNITSPTSTSTSSGPTATSNTTANGTTNGTTPDSTAHHASKTLPLILGPVLGLSCAIGVATALYFWIRRRQSLQAAQSSSPMIATPLNPEKYPGELTDEEAVHVPRELASPEQMWGGWVKGGAGGLGSGVGARELRTRNEGWGERSGDKDKDEDRKGDGERKELIAPVEMEG